MHANSSSEESNLDLLQQLESIFNHDKLIDEVGFLHPTQLAELNEDADIDGIDVQNDKLNMLQYNRKVFWVKNHKLAISIRVLTGLYNAAYHAYKDLIISYKESVRSTVKKDLFDDAKCEAEILKHTTVILILSYDFKSIWNSRKLVLSRKQDTLLFQDEFQLSTLILSYAPKSESAWSHRRWLIKIIAEKQYDLYELIGKESEFVKSIAEKSKMNYRAWNHRCWLVSYMSKTQMVDELNKSRKWAELHVADNCCFHYHRKLMLRILDDDFVKGDKGSVDIYASTVHSIWKDELQWNKMLLQRYIGREALWIHRRFLSQCWLKKLAPIDAVDNFLCEETELLYACLDIVDDEFSDGRSQAKYAVSYVLWVSKHIDLNEEIKFHKRLEEIGGLEVLLDKNCPERRLLWKKLLG